MSLIQKFTQALLPKRLKPKPRRAARAVYGAAAISRLTASLASEARYINNTLRQELKLLRIRSREAFQNNPYAKKFITMFVDNVFGSNPFIMQAKVLNASGKLDYRANSIIEKAWTESVKHFDIQGKHRWRMLQRLIGKVFATDGEVFIRMYQNHTDDKRENFQIQVIDADRIDEQLNRVLPNGNVIHMGIELSPVGKPVAYWVLKRKAIQYSTDWLSREYEIIPAEQMIHAFIPDFAEQVRGVPLMYAALLNLHNIGATDEAALVAARIGASAMGLIESPDGGESLAYDGENDDGDPQIELEPGTFPVLPPGYTMNKFEAKYPDTMLAPFLEHMLMGVSSALGVAYHNLASNMKGVNYSSARVAELSEREMWMTIQDFISESIHQRVYDNWLGLKVLTGELKFQPLNLDKYKNILWQGRRWKWVDPAKEVSAHVAAINAGLTSKTRVIAEQGADIEDIMNEIAAEQEMEKEKGITSPAPAKPDEPAKPDDEPDEAENTDEEDQETDDEPEEETE